MLLKQYDPSDLREKAYRTIYFYIIIVIFLINKKIFYLKNGILHNQVTKMLTYVLDSHANSTSGVFIQRCAFVVEGDREDWTHTMQMSHVIQHWSTSSSTSLLKALAHHSATYTSLLYLLYLSYNLQLYSS